MFNENKCETPVQYKIVQVEAMFATKRRNRWDRMTVHPQTKLKSHTSAPGMHLCSNHDGRLPSARSISQKFQSHENCKHERNFVKGRPTINFTRWTNKTGYRVIVYNNRHKLTLTNQQSWRNVYIHMYRSSEKKLKAKHCWVTVSFDKEQLWASKRPKMQGRTQRYQGVLPKDGKKFGKE